MHDIDRAEFVSHRPSRGRPGLVVALSLVVALGLAGCSGDSGDGDEPPATTSASSDGGGGDPFSESDAGADDGSGDAGADDEFDPENAVDEPVEGDFDLEVDDDVIIGTEDGEIPSTTTDPPVAEDGPDAPPPSDAPATSAPAVPLPAPEDVVRIVSLSPTHTETLFALGLGDFVVAVDAESDFPEAALAVRRGDLDPTSADLSSILAFDPDVVVIGEDPTGIVDRLAAEGVATFSGPPATSIDEVYAQIRSIAELVGRPDLADDVVAAMRADIDEIVASLPDGTSSYFQEIDPSLNAVGQGEFPTGIYDVLGLVNIAGAAGPGGAVQLGGDEIVAADPDLILLADADCCGVTPELVASRPGWSALSAVQAGAIVTIPDDLATRWGPRVVDLLRIVAGAALAAG